MARRKETDAQRFHSLFLAYQEGDSASGDLVADMLGSLGDEDMTWFLRGATEIAVAALLDDEWEQTGHPRHLRAATQ